MSVYQRTNFAKSLITDNPLASGATTVNLTPGDGALFPSSGNFPLVLWDKLTYPDPSDDPNVEITLATARSTDAITITRAQEGTAAVQHEQGYAIEELITAGVFTDLADQNLKTTDNVNFGTIGCGAITSSGASTFNSGSVDADFTVNWNTGTGLFVQGSDGNVGIGTISPGTKLDVSGTITIRDGNGVLSNVDNSLTIYSGGDATNSGGNLALFGGEHATLANVIRFRQDGTEVMVIDSSGNVGIGKTSDGAKLHVLAGAQVGIEIERTASDPIFRLSDGTNDWDLKQDNTDESFIIRDATAALDRFRINSAGNIGIGTTIPTTILSIGDTLGTPGDPEARLNIGNSDGTSGFGFGEDVNNRAFIIWDNTNDLVHMGTRVSSVTYVNTLILDSGKVGIGTASPDTKLQVVGDTKLGDDNTNYASFATDGELTLTGTARVTRDSWLAAGAINAPHANPASLIAHGLCSAWSFANAIEVNQEHVCALKKVPIDMDRSVAPTMCIGWSSDSEEEDVKWQVKYLWTSPDENTAGAAQETLTVVDSSSSISDGLIVTEISGIDVPSATDMCLHIKITRLSADELDTIENPVELHGLALIYTSNKLGIAT